jgi:arylsulfatase A-like enzyme
MCAAVFVLGCGGPAPLTVDTPLHLEEHLDAAIVVGSEVPDDALEPIVWDFSEPQPEWKAPEHYNPTIPPLTLERIDDALRVTFDERNADPRTPMLHGDIYVDLPDLRRDEWSHVLIRARASEGMVRINIGFNLNDRAIADDLDLGMLQSYGDLLPLVNDGTVQTYRLRADWQATQSDWRGPWRQMAFTMNARKPSSLDILSITLVSKATVYGELPVGVSEIRLGRHYRRALYTHTPGRLEYQVQVPDGGRLDVGLGVLSDDVPVTFRVSATGGAGSDETVFEDTCSDASGWHQRSVDLADYAGREITLALETETADTGAVAFWGAPTVSGAPLADKPNVIFYVIDGAGAEYMSLYGYNRRTTPNLERLAAEGAVFERAYSNSRWTRPSTASFMTSLQHSVMGGFRSGFNVVPDGVPTMAQHLHRAGYQTSVFIANPNAGRMSGLEREVDFHQEDWEQFSYASGGANYEESSRYLNEAFWRWREAYPAEPYWVHFQSVDIHEEFPAVAPFSGLFVGPEQWRTAREWNSRLGEEGGHGEYSEAYEKTGISRVEFFTVWQGLYDETMAHNDHQIGRLVDRLKSAGEWENTLLIVGADHSIEAAMDDMGIAIQDSLPPRWSQPMFRPSISRIPLLFVWSGHIKGGQRFSEPVVSMIDVLPTMLDLLNLPEPEVMMGQSLAPVLLGTGGWEPRPVILDEFEMDLEAGVFRGVIEVVDGRWGASLEVNPEPPDEDDDEEDAQRRRPVPLLLFDLWNDPYCLHSVHEERPDLVEKYTAFLEAQWAAHQALAQRFTPGEQVELTPEQLETLRALGYIQ